jgi:hypothetical protein
MQLLGVEWFAPAPRNERDGPSQVELCACVLRDPGPVAGDGKVQRDLTVPGEGEGGEDEDED